MRCDMYIYVVRQLRVNKHSPLSYNKSQRDALFIKFILVKNSTCFGQIYCQSSGVSTLYTQQLAFVMIVMLTVCMTDNNCCVYSVETPDDGQ